MKEHQKQAKIKQDEFKKAVKESYEFLQTIPDVDESRIVIGLTQTLLDTIEEIQDSKGEMIKQ